MAPLNTINSNLRKRIHRTVPLPLSAPADKLPRMTNPAPITPTQSQRAMARTYLAYQGLSSLYFVSAVWLYFYRLYITDAQVGILDALAFTIGLVAEVPSGALADRFGRGKVARLGLILTGISYLIQAAGSGFMPFFIGQSVMMIGVSFTSGADDALFFSKINFDRNSAEWRKLVTRGSQAALLGSLAATLIGGWLHTINPRLPWMLCGAAFIGAAALIWRINDPAPAPSKLSVKNQLLEHYRDIQKAFLQFAQPKLLRYVPLILTAQALFYATGWGLLRIVLLDRFHFDPLTGSVVVALCNILTVAALSYIHRHAETMTERHVLAFIALSAAASLLVAIPDIGSWGFGVIFALYAGERILYPYLSETLHKNATDDQRATVLSIASFLKTLPYVALAPLIGTLNTQGKLFYFLIFWPTLIGAALWFYLSQKPEERKDSATGPVT
jgi:MFS family permease